MIKKRNNATIMAKFLTIYYISMLKNEITINYLNITKNCRWHTIAVQVHNRPHQPEYQSPVHISCVRCVPVIIRERYLDRLLSAPK